MDDLTQKSTFWGIYGLLAHFFHQLCHSKLPLIDFHNHMCNRLSVEEMNKNAGMNMGQCRKVMLAISKACRNAPSKNQGIKIHNIYVGPGWMEKLKSYKWILSFKVIMVEVLITPYIVSVSFFPCCNTYGVIYIK